MNPFKFGNTSHDPVETGRVLSSHELIITRIQSLITSRTLVTEAIPLPDERAHSKQLMEAAAEQALKMVERTMPAQEPQPEIITEAFQFPAANPLEAAQRAVSRAFEEAA